MDKKKMKKKYGFRTLEDALRFADKNYYRGTYKIKQTNVGTFAIELQS